MIFPAASGAWQYPRHYTGAFVLGNLQLAVLVRNELFGRFLYFTVNALFAQVTPPSLYLRCLTVIPRLISGRPSGSA